MLTQIQIEGFKAIKQSGPIDLGPFTLLIGRNGSGKSSLIEAIQWLQEAVFLGLRDATQQRFVSFEALLNRRSESHEIALSLVHGAGVREVRYLLRTKAGKFSPIVQSERCREGRTRGAQWTILSRKGAKGPAVRSIVGGNPVRDGDALALASVAKTKATGAERLLEFLRDAVFLRLSPTAMARGGRLLPSARGPRLDEEGRDLVALLGELSNAQRDEVRRHVAEILSGVEGIEVVKAGESSGYFEARERMRVRGGKRVFSVPSWMLSEGTRRITAIFALLAVRPRPSLVAIEEIENGLDPWTLRVVLDALREASSEGVQVLLTTHSPFLLDHMKPEEILHVRRVDGDTRYERMTDFDEVVRYQRVITPGAMYVGGYLRDIEPEVE